MQWGTQNHLFHCTACFGPANPYQFGRDKESILTGRDGQQDDANCPHRHHIRPSPHLLEIGFLGRESGKQHEREEASKVAVNEVGIGLT